jgi:hypothetical protein
MVTLLHLVHTASMLPLLHLLRTDCLACLVSQAWVASQFSGFQVQLGDILSSQVADALATERTKTDTDIAQVGNTCNVLSGRLHLERASHQCKLTCTPIATELADVGPWSLSCSASL